MKTAFQTILLVLMLMVLTKCDKEFVSRDFPSVVTLSVVPKGAEGIIFSGEIIGRNAGAIDETGFIWQMGADPLEQPGFKINLGAPSKSGEYQAIISSSINKGSKYFVRAYALSGNIKAFGEKLEFVSESDLPIILNKFEPLTGHAGDTMRISGEQFNSTLSLNQVKFDTLSSQVVGVTDSVLQCIVPMQLKSKLSTIKVITSGSQGEFNTKFTLVTPVINSFTPIEAYLGEVVKISGTGFHKQSALNQVRIGNLSVNNLSSNESEITFQVPYTTDTLCNISVTVSGQTAVSQTKLAIYLPHFNLFAPVFAANLDTITLNITNLRPEKSVSVYFNNIPGRIILRDRSFIMVEVPGNLKQRYSEIKVVINGVSYIFDIPFTLMEPLITSLSASKIKYGNILTIYGINFNPSAGTTLIYITDNNKTYILTPEYVSSDSIKVQIYNHLNPTQLLDLSSFRVGIKTFEDIIWSDYYVSLESSWKRVRDLPGSARYKTSSFSLGGDCYIGGGAGNGDVYKDLWKYNPESDTWTRMADLPGIARCYPRAFSNSTNGFLGTGYSSDNSSKFQLYDFYKYNPQSDSWSSISDYPDNILNFYPGFTVTVNGRPFASLSNQILSMREWINDTWISRPTISDMIDCPAAGVFSIGNKFYVIVGYRINNTYSNSVWEYNSENGNWTKKANFPGPVRHSLAFFSIGNYGYYGCGMSTDQTQYKDMWRYDPSNDKWIRIEDFPGGIRSHLISSTAGKYGFVGLGLVLYPVTYFNDFWKFDPE